MTASRLSAWALLAAAGFTLLPAPAPAQDRPLPSRPNIDFINAALDRPIIKDELEQTRKQLAKFAEYYADYVAHPLVHKGAVDPSKIPTGSFFLSVDDQIASLNKYVADPVPRNAARWNADKAEYIKEFGVAFDAALKKVVETDPERVVRVNAARVYAFVCRSGAAAHWPTVTGWLTNANTPTEIKHYALQAAANLLAAYDVSSYGTRRHAVAIEPRVKANEVIGALVAAVDKCVTNPNLLVAVPGGVAANPGGAAVAAFVRRQAIRALAQVRFVTLPGPDGRTPLYPAVTLARVCLSDPALAPAPELVPTPADCAEAVIGLCNMAPMVEQKGGTAMVPLKGYNHNALSEAVATGLVTFATPRVDPLNKSLPWKGYAARIGDAMRGWRPLFDPRFDPVLPGVKIDEELTAAPRSPVADLIKRTQDAVLTPIDGGARGVDIEAMRALVKQLQANPKRSAELIDGDPATRLPTAPKK